MVNAKAKRKIKLYLCDLVHNYLGVGTYMFPLNISYIAGYTKKYFRPDVDIKLFKYPLDFMKKFQEEKPDIVGFSNYTWNSDINNKISEWVKSVSPETLVVFGGPNIDYTQEGYTKFFKTHSGADFYIPYQGEIPFINLLERIDEKGTDVSDLKSDPIDGVVFYDMDSDNPVCGKTVPRIRDLDSIPSPYLTGFLDEFFDTNLIPIVETNRGCPYTCTFCAQGFSSNNRLDLFDLDRVKAELDYIAHKVKNTNILNLADANFGIIERDIEIAKYIAELSEKTPNLKKFNTNWAKNQPKLFEIAKILKNSNLIISLQSLDAKVLEKVKRSNIKISVFKDIMDSVNTLGGMSGTEVILGLPEETKESHIKTLRDLFDWDVSYLICYNALLLEGTEMSQFREKGEFECSTKYRLIDNSFGKYQDIVSFEAEEGIRSTSAMSEEEILFFRPVHWLIQFLWNYRFYYDLLKYFQFLGINPLDYILRLMDKAENDTAFHRISEIFQEFNEEAEKEWFDSIDDLQEHYSRSEPFQDLKDGKHGKMNGKYIFKALLEAKEAFNEFLYQTAVDYSDLTRSKEAVIKDIFNFLSTSIIDFTDDWDEICPEREIICKYDIPGWRKSGHKGDLESFYRKEGIRYRFYIPEDQKRTLEVLLKQYAHDNKNVTLRKMSEYMDIRDFFRKVDVVKDAVIASK
ncbi:MAG: radical SAM protein [Candidatus Omnitrophica bacterium]|nr:radical SAM protein [Candidatus Omnitrophota bacterium]